MVFRWTGSFNCLSKVAKIDDFNICRWWKVPVSELKTPDYPIVNKKTTCAEALKAMGEGGYIDLALVEDDDG